MEDKYYKIEVVFENCTNQIVEEIQEASNDEFGCDGIEEFSMDEDQVDNLLGERSYSGGDLPGAVLNEVDEFNNSGDSIQHNFYFSNGSDPGARAKSFTAFLREKKLEKGNLVITFNEEKSEDWNTVWRSQFETIEIDEEMAVIPSWKSIEEVQGYSEPVIIYPGQGFGTGNHETTYLCLKSLKEFRNLINPSFEVLDYGCGSGILGIAAKRLGANKIDLYDIDEEAIANCRENIGHNFDQSKGFRCLLPKDKNSFEKKYDLIFANILAPILEEISIEILNLSREKSLVILSGLLRNQVDWITKVYEENGFMMLKHTYKNDWSCLVFKYSGG